MTKDMTTGSPMKNIIKFCLPVMLGNLFQQFYNIVDSVIVGRFVGAEALAAVGICSAPYGVFIALNMGLSSGIGIVISQLFGAKMEDRIRKTVVNALILTVVAALLTGGVGFILSPQLLNLLGTPESIFRESVIYMRVVFASTLGMAFIALENGVIR